MLTWPHTTLPRLQRGTPGRLAGLCGGHPLHRRHPGKPNSKDREKGKMEWGMQGAVLESMPQASAHPLHSLVELHC